MRAIGHGEDYFSGKTFTADSGYHSPTNLDTCDKEKLDAYIPDNNMIQTPGCLSATRPTSRAQSRRTGRESQARRAGIQSSLS